MDDHRHVILINQEVILGKAERTQAITLPVTGIECNCCMNRVLLVGAEANPVTGKAEVTYIPTKVLIGTVAETSDNAYM